MAILIMGLVRGKPRATAVSFPAASVAVVFWASVVGIAPVFASVAGVIGGAVTFDERTDSVNARDGEGRTPLHAAVVAKNKEACKALIGHGADVNAKTKSGLLPIHLAADAGDKEIVALLLLKGADVNAKTATGQTPRDRAKAAKCDDMEDFLIEKGARIKPMIERVE